MISEASAYSLFSLKKDTFYQNVFKQHLQSTLRTCVHPLGRKILAEVFILADKLMPGGMTDSDMFYQHFNSLQLI